MAILLLTVSFELTDALQIKSVFEVMQQYTGMFQSLYKTGRLMVMLEVLSTRLVEGQNVANHLIQMRRLFDQLKRLEYPVSEDQLVMLIYNSLIADYQVPVEESIKKGGMTVKQLHEMIVGIDNSLKLKNVEFEKVDYMEDEDWLNDIDCINLDDMNLEDICCPECGSKEECEHIFDLSKMDLGSPGYTGIFMIDCLFTSHESWVLDTGCGNHICNHLQGFTRSRSLRQGDMDLRVGEGSVIGAEAVGTYSLVLPSGMILELKNCYYVPRLIKNIISYDLLIDDDFKYVYNHKNILCYKNDIFYFQASSINGLYYLNLRDNTSEVYHISKRSKQSLNQAYVWHCRLGHINMKRVQKLLKDGILEPFDVESYGNCKSCLSGKMTKKPFNKSAERAGDLLEIIHTDVCGPFSHKARNGYRYFITFTDDFSSMVMSI